MSQVKTVTILNAVTTNQSSAAYEPWGTRRTIHARVVGTGAVAGTVDYEVSNDGTNFLSVSTITLTGTTSDMDVAAADHAFRYARVTLSGISGTGAAVTVILGSHNG